MVSQQYSIHEVIHHTYRLAARASGYLFVAWCAAIDVAPNLEWDLLVPGWGFDVSLNIINRLFTLRYIPVNYARG